MKKTQTPKRNRSYKEVSAIHDIIFNFILAAIWVLDLILFIVKNGFDWTVTCAIAMVLILLAERIYNTFERYFAAKQEAIEKEQQDLEEDGDTSEF